ncbi:MAG: hypothetical protein HY957_09525 [Nitrospirae bacterium]|nr:hypothetical protein [Nitrospirota bacterium]
MAKGKKAKSSVNNNIEVYRHETDKRKNAVPVGIASYDTTKPKPKKYEYDPHLEFFAGNRSLPFKIGKEKRIAVKVIDHRGNEVMVREIE